jgi:S-methylmethionine-dependent homocysteine/selenocysteine methylase
LAMKMNMPRSKTVLLDGGMGHQLRVMGVKIEGVVGTMERFLGVALANETNPTLVRDAHLAFIDAGADVITTNNYAVVPAALELSERHSGSSAELQRMVSCAGAAARAAVEARPERTVRIAGSLPPLHESYRADRVGPLEENLAQYRLIAAALTPVADILLCETMSTAQEALAAATAAAETGKPVWVSWTLDEKEPKLRSGETIRMALETLRDGGLLQGSGGSKSGPIEAFLFNCTSPEVTTLALQLLRDEPLLPPGAAIGGYANGFVLNNTAEGGKGEYRDLSPGDYFTEFVSKWLNGDEIEEKAEGGDGRAVVVGGCCGIFPEHIARIRQGIDGSTPCPTCADSLAPSTGMQIEGNRCMCCTPERT